MCPAGRRPGGRRDDVGGGVLLRLMSSVLVAIHTCGYLELDRACNILWLDASVPLLSDSGGKEYRSVVRQRCSCHAVLNLTLEDS
jgi:hypothetical protein